MNTFSIMQGRLSPPDGNRLQFFPKDWQAEFSIAKDLGFDAITWFLDPQPGFDPIRDIWGNAEQLKEIDEARKIFPINSIDCGMYPLFGDQAQKTIENFKILISGAGSHLHSRILSVPILEHLAPKTESEKNAAHETLQKIADIAAQSNLKLALETEIPAPELAAYIDSFQGGNVGVCYDIGNCTSYGFDCPSDISFLGPRIIDVHIKDRKKGETQSVLLGNGDADFVGCFKALAKVNYRGVHTLQAWRGENYLQDAKNQLEYIKNIYEKTYQK